MPPPSAPTDAARAQYAAATPPGELLLFAGRGQGKTAAALGLILRSLGRGFACGLVCFGDAPFASGEALLAPVMPRLWYFGVQQAQQGLGDGADVPQRAAAEAWLRACAALRDGHHRLLVLDDLPAGMQAAGLSPDAVVAALASRPKHVHVVLTGTTLPARLCGLADRVTELQPGKPRPEHVSLGLDC